MFENIKKIDIANSSSDPEHHIYQLISSGIMVRYADIEGIKKGEEVRIMQSTDFHLNRIDRQDGQENNPVVASIGNYCETLRDEQAVHNAWRTMEFFRLFDARIITGDTLDYLTWGSLELLKECIWDIDGEAIVTLGDHDLTRKKQESLDDETSLESRYDILKEYWEHDVAYVSRVIKDRVMIIALDNGRTGYYGNQAELLRADIERAKKEKLTVLIFQHNPICTKNPEEVSVEPIRVNDETGTRNFCENFIGAAHKDPITDEVYRLITENADVVKGIFCGHMHSDFYTEVCGSYEENGQKTPQKIPQYVLTGNMFDQGHILAITVK